MATQAKTSPRGSIPPQLKSYMENKYGAKEIEKLNEVQFKIAGAISQADLENERGTFTTQRQKAFVGYI